MYKALYWLVAGCALAGSLALAADAKAAATPPGGGISYAVAPATSGRLYDIVAVSDSDVWAVGLNGGGALVVHWNGSAWSHSQLAGGFFTGVAASPARDVWAVGGTNWFTGSKPLAEHWTGASWQRVATPSPAGGGYFNAVTATSPSSAWAVGLVGPGPGVPSATTPLIEHWNGKTWAIQPVQVPAGGGQFAGVAALSPSNAWAVGQTGASSEGTGQRTLIEHWNGTSWTRMPSPNVGTVSVLRAITIVSAGNAWAVGSYIAADGTNRTLALHWNGRTWTVAPSATPGGGAQFLGVTASWTNNIWAVGYTNLTSCSPKCQTLIEHWNSVAGKWRVLPSPNPPSGYLNMLWGISAVSRGDIWAAGTTDYGSTLIIHWNGTAWS